jgi:biotin carboxyl carrier protein
MRYLATLDIVRQERLIFVRPGIFRAKALDRLSSPDQLDQLMKVTSARSWLAMIALAAVIAAAVVWGFVGNLPRSVSGQAILTQPDGIRNIVTTIPGVVAELRVAPGDEVKQGQVIALVSPLPGQGETNAQGATASPAVPELIPVASTNDGHVVEMLAAPGTLLDVGDPVLSLESEKGALMAFVYVSDGPGKQVEPGMEVQVSPSTVESSQYGFMIGRVVSVSEYPVTELGLSALLANNQLTQRFLSDGPVLQVMVELVEDPATPSGYKWSSSDGPPFELTNGTLASGSVVLNEQRPVDFVLPGS